jgi:hypothetical protein
MEDDVMTETGLGRTAWFTDYAKSNPIVVASTLTSLLGGLLLLSYAISLRQFPDIPLSALSGILIAVCATGLFFVVMIVLACLLPGLAARQLTRYFYPAADDGTLHPDLLHLLNGRFFWGAAILAILVWSWLLPALPVHGKTDAMCTVCMVIACTACLILILCDWRHSRLFACIARHVVLAVGLGSFSYLLSSWLWPGTPTAPPVHAVAPKPTPSLADLCIKALNGFMPDHRQGTAVIVVAAVLLSGVLRKWGPALCRWIQRQPFTQKLFPNRRDSFLPKRLDAGAWKLLGVKVAVLMSLTLSALLPLFFACLITASGSLHWPLLGLLICMAYFVMLNAVVFTSKSRRFLLISGVAGAITVFWILPTTVHNPTFLPKLLVNTLGFGNIHADSVALSSRQCANLARYSAHCQPGAEGTVSLHDVNLLDRLGASVLLELEVRRDELHATPGDTSPAAELHEPTTGKPQSYAQGCDENLALQLEQSDTPRYRQLACVRLSVPKEQFYGYTGNGPRRYTGAYTTMQLFKPAPAKTPDASGPL